MTMVALLSVVPVGVSGALWWGLHHLNRKLGWFRIGELIFWDVIALIVIYLAWLRWF